MQQKYKCGQLKSADAVSRIQMAILISRPHNPRREGFRQSCKLFTATMGETSSGGEQMVAGDVQATL